MGIAESLDIVEDEPGQRDDHQDDEGDRDEEDRRLGERPKGVGRRVAVPLHLQMDMSFIR